MRDSTEMKTPRGGRHCLSPAIAVASKSALCRPPQCAQTIHRICQHHAEGPREFRRDDWHSINIQGHRPSQPDEAGNQMKAHLHASRALYLEQTGQSQNVNLNLADRAEELSIPYDETHPDDRHIHPCQPLSSCCWCFDLQNGFGGEINPRLDLLRKNPPLTAFSGPNRPFR